MKKPFTKEEQEIMDLLVLAHNKLINLDNHGGDMADWVHHLHGCQNVLITRIVRRDYPDVFNQ